jgi:hypothetical protein
MQAVLTLPEGYHEVTFWQATPKRLFLLNVASLILLIIGAVFLGGWLVFYHGVLEAPLVIDDLPNTLPPILGVLGLVVLVFVHEGFHGLAIQYYGLTPRYGLKPRKGVAYATPRMGYLWRRQYQGVLFAPLVGITLLAMVGIVFVSLEVGLWLSVWGAANVASAIGDVWMAWVAQSYPPDTLVYDEEEGMRFFRPALMSY